jgi:hypothetical protein
MEMYLLIGIASIKIYGFGCHSEPLEMQFRPAVLAWSLFRPAGWQQH